MSSLDNRPDRKWTAAERWHFRSLLRGVWDRVRQLEQELAVARETAELWERALGPIVEED